MTSVWGVLIPADTLNFSSREATSMASARMLSAFVSASGCLGCRRMAVLSLPKSAQTIRHSGSDSSAAILARANFNSDRSPAGKLRSNSSYRSMDRMATVTGASDQSSK
ncbi:hypothetical protein D3C76_1158940 [compost metagenome]